MKILFLSRWFPYPADNGSKLRIYSLLRGLNQHHNVTLLSFADQPNINLELPIVRSLCSDVQVVPWKEFNPHSLQARLGFLSWKPRSVIDTFSTEMAQKIKQVLGNKSYDLVIASQLPMAAYYPYFQNVPAIFEELEVGLFHDQAFSSDRNVRFRQALTWYKLRLYISKLLGSFQGCTVVSDQERRLFAINFPGYKNHIEVIPNCLNVDEYNLISAEKKQDTLIFTGSFRYHTNYEAMVWFVRDVFPLVLKQIPTARLIITGDHANLPLPSLQNIMLAGYVDDIKFLIASCALSIAPLLDGGGTRLKILESMALGTPVIATSKGSEGLDVLNNEHLLQADAPDEFAECVVTLLRNDVLRMQLAENAKRLVQTKYNWGTELSKYLRLIDNVVSSN